MAIWSWGGDDHIMFMHTPRPFLDERRVCSNCTTLTEDEDCLKVILHIKGVSTENLPKFSLCHYLLDDDNETYCCMNAAKVIEVCSEDNYIYNVTVCSEHHKSIVKENPFELHRHVCCRAHRIYRSSQMRLLMTRLRDLEDKVLKVYYAPGMPGYIEGKAHWDELLAREEKREEKREARSEEKERKGSSWSTAASRAEQVHREQQQEPNKQKNRRQRRQGKR